MKRIIILLFLSVSALAQAQKPETVYSVAREWREFSWYETQLKLWKAEVNKNPKDANAWYNYFSACRALLNSSSDPAHKELYRNQCDQIAKDALAAVPNSFEANHMQWWHTSNLPSAFPYLKKANEIDPTDVRAFDDLMIHYELTGDKALFRQFATQLYEANDLWPSVLNWGYNLLSEVDENAVIFTAGDNDTYACWVVQAAKNYRPDVRIINTSLIRVDDYRNRLLAELGLPPLVIQPGTDPETTWKKILDHFFSPHGKVPVYVSGTAVQQFESSLGDHLFLTGLAYKYAPESFDNISIIRRNYEKRFLLDYLTEQFSYTAQGGIPDYFEGAYLPMLLKLHNHYQESEEIFKLQELEEKILRISEKSGQQGEIYKLIGAGKAPKTFQAALLDVHTIDQNSVPLYGQIQIGRYEVTNHDYQLFLTNLLRSRQGDLLKRAMYDSTQWMKKFEDAHNEPMTATYHSHPAYADYPVVNITHEAAVAYCAWLTEQYNSQRQRKYTQVVFRLPTEKEWKYAAGAGNPALQTGFDKDAVRNSKGIYQANIKTPEGFAQDGAFYTAKVKSYVPNRLDIYNMTGNVAEMTDQPGIAKGGSWYNTLEEANFQQSTSYMGADPRVGFRIVLEIIAE